MFTRARWKLTTWYLLILATIIVAFTVSLYFVSRNSILRANERQITVLRQSTPEVSVLRVDREAIQDELKDLRSQLLLIDVILLGVGGILSFVLAGRTLRPIQRMIDQQQAFVSNASHELKTPLAVMMADLDVTLRKSRSKSEYQALLKRLRQEIDRLGRLSKNLLLIAGANEQGLSRDELRLDFVVKQSIESFKSLAHTQNLKLKSSLKTTRVKGNSDQLRQLVDILLDNALKYTPSGGEVEIKTSSNKRRPTLVVSDTGPGIPRSMRTRIFERFTRLVSDRNGISGAGLGLSIAQAIVASHQAIIRVESRSPKGSSFIVTFPRL